MFFGQVEDAVSEFGDFAGDAVASGCCYQDFYTEVLRCPDCFSEVAVSGDEHCRVDDSPAREAYKV